MTFVLKGNEGDLVFTRNTELLADPVRGNFDIAHLKEINRRLFQDFPANGLTDVTPGEFRPALMEPGKDWMKNRGLETNPTRDLFVTYSRMDEAAVKRLGAALETAKPEVLSKLKTEEFTKRFGELYAELDYIHPFIDGNSRTLRAFTKQLAKASGYELDWDRFGKSPGGRDVLYIARDLSVNKLAKPHVQSEGTIRRIGHTQNILEKSRDLPDLLRDAIRPSRAVAFERWSQEEALQAFPELKEAYEAKRIASTTLQATHAGQPVLQEKAMKAFSDHVQARLNAGEVSNFAHGREATKNVEQTAQREIKKPEPGIER